jgi:plastocyanin
MDVEGNAVTHERPISLTRRDLIAVALAGVPLAASVGRTGASRAPDGITVVASGLANPRGFEWDRHGDLYVALAGTGGTKITTSSSSSPEETIVGATLSGQTASVVRIMEGCGVAVAEGLPSTQDPFGDVQGPVDVGFIDDQLYILQDATGGYEAVGRDFPNGLYTLDPDASIRLINDGTAYVAAQPASHLYHVLELGEPFAMVEIDGDFWVVDANQGLLLRVELSGATHLVADLSLGHPVPTAIAAAPGGGVFVGFLTAAPHLDGTAKVVRVTPDGEVTDYWTGLTAVTGLATTGDGTLYALEMATGNQTTQPNMFPNTGKLVRQTGPGSKADVVTELDFPISLAVGPDGGFYISAPAFSTQDERGGILRVDPSVEGPIAMPANMFDHSTCVSQAGATPAATPESATPIDDGTTTELGTPVPTVAADATPADLGAKQGVASLAVLIQNQAFTPATLDVAAGGIVTWTNLDVDSHSVTSDNGAFDSGALGSGESFIHAFDDPGTYAYSDSFHPDMRGTVIVG